MPIERRHTDKAAIAGPASEYDEARGDVTNAVAHNIEKWAAKIGLRPTDATFTQFREDVTEALHACMRGHIAAQHRRHHRASDLRRDFIALANAATAAAQKMRSVDDILKRLPPMHHDPAFKLMHGPLSTAYEIEGLAEAASRHADECKAADQGGPPRMRAFEALAEGLIRAYQRGTGRTGVGRSAREGQLLDLVEAVLPRACKLAEAVTSEALTAPTSDGLGEYLHRIAGRP
jgi:hypothetical protein